MPYLSPSPTPSANRSPSSQSSIVNDIPPLVQRPVKNYTPYLSPSPTPSANRSPSTPSGTGRLKEPGSKPKISGLKRKARSDSDADCDNQSEGKDGHRPLKRQETHASSSHSADSMQAGASIVRQSLSGKVSVNRVRTNAKQSHSISELSSRRSAGDLEGTIPGWILRVIAKSSKGRMPCVLCGDGKNPTTLDRHVLTVHRRKLAETLMKKEFDGVRQMEYITMFYFVIAEAHASQGYQMAQGEDEETRHFLQVHGQEFREGDFDPSRYPVLQNRCMELCGGVCSTFVCRCGKRFGRQDAMNRHQSNACKMKT